MSNYQVTKTVGPRPI